LGPDKRVLLTPNEFRQIAHFGDDNAADRALALCHQLGIVMHIRNTTPQLVVLSTEWLARACGAATSPEVSEEGIRMNGVPLYDAKAGDGICERKALIQTLREHNVMVSSADADEQRIIDLLQSIGVLFDATPNARAEREMRYATTNLDERFSERSVSPRVGVTVSGGGAFCVGTAGSVSRRSAATAEVAALCHPRGGRHHHHFSRPALWRLCRFGVSKRVYHHSTGCGDAPVPRVARSHVLRCRRAEHRIGVGSVRPSGGQRSV
jgi:hypothetical protein